MKKRYSVDQIVAKLQLVVIDEFTRKCLAIEIRPTFTHRDVILMLQYVFAVRGAPEHIRPDNWSDICRQGGSALAEPCYGAYAIHQQG